MTNPIRAPGRADARRNREKLITAARRALADGALVMESLAREAGVGVGTLYRHFPTREALIEAVYAAELEDLTSAAVTLLKQSPPEVALRQWMDHYATFTATKSGMMDTLRRSLAAGRIALHTRERVSAAMGVILDRGVKAGTLRGDVDPVDAATMLHGALLASVDGDDPQRTTRLLNLLADALSAPASTAREREPPGGHPEPNQAHAAGTPTSMG